MAFWSCRFLFGTPYIGKGILCMKRQNTTLSGVLFMARKNDMALRDAIYYGRTMEKMVEPYPKEKILKLSNAYLEKTDHPMLELSARVININLLSNYPILGACRPLYEYSWFIQQIK